MKAQDFMNQDNNRSEAIRKIQEFCHANGLDYAYTEKAFKIVLPVPEPVPVRPIIKKQRKGFDTSNWGPKGVDETALPDELPPTITPLEEGKPPEGNDER